jgi:hypothetical protein
MAFCGVNDSYEMYYQAIRRCWRFGQTKPVDVHVVVSTLERQIVDNVRRKETESAAMTSQLVHAMQAEHRAAIRPGDSSDGWPLGRSAPRRDECPDGAGAFIQEIFARGLSDSLWLLDDHR